eukprot:6194708-Pleurochrysis_carterae.AAC.3
MGQSKDLCHTDTGTRRGRCYGESIYLLTFGLVAWGDRVVCGYLRGASHCGASRTRPSYRAGAHRGIIVKVRTHKKSEGKTGEVRRRAPVRCAVYQAGLPCGRVAGKTTASHGGSAKTSSHAHAPPTLLTPLRIKQRYTPSKQSQYGTIAERNQQWSWTVRSGSEGDHACASANRTQ